MVPVLQPMTAIGGTGTLIFGVWLAISLDDYEPWDGWILASLVLWVIAAVSGETAGARYKRAGARAAEVTRSGDDAPTPSSPRWPATAAASPCTRSPRSRRSASSSD